MRAGRTHDWKRCCHRVLPEPLTAVSRDPQPVESYRQPLHLFPLVLPQDQSREPCRRFHPVDCPLARAPELLSGGTVFIIVGLPVQTMRKTNCSAEFHCFNLAISRSIIRCSFSFNETIRGLKGWAAVSINGGFHETRSESRHHRSEAEMGRPPENRPRSYEPADDDPAKKRDAAGHSLADPDRKNVADALSEPKHTRRKGGGQ